MTTTLHGIRNCDTVRRARRWLEDRGVPYEFHDFKTAGVERAMLERWCGRHGFERVLNRAGTTFRKLPEPERAEIDEAKAIRLMIEHPSLIRRPVLEHEDAIEIGFNAEGYERLFG